MRRVIRQNPWLVVGFLLVGAPLLLVLPLVPVAYAGPPQEIGTAQAAGKPVFLVVTQGAAPGTDRAVQVAREAQALAPNSALVVLDRGLAENQELVQRFRVLAAPVPLVLVVAPNGVVAGGALLKDATPQVLANLIPTPKKAEMLLHQSQRLAVLVVVSRATMVEERSTVFEACNEAVKRLNRKVVTIALDAADPAEKAFLAELKIDPKETAVVTAVFNEKGQKTNVLRGRVTPEQLVESVTKKAACGPGGCGPGGC